MPPEVLRRPPLPGRGDGQALAHGALRGWPESFWQIKKNQDKNVHTCAFSLKRNKKWFASTQKKPLKFSIQSHWEKISTKMHYRSKVKTPSICPHLKWSTAYSSSVWGLSCPIPPGDPPPSNPLAEAGKRRRPCSEGSMANRAWIYNNNKLNVCPNRAKRKFALKWSLPKKSRVVAPSWVFPQNFFATTLRRWCSWEGRRGIVSNLEVFEKKNSNCVLWGNRTTHPHSPECKKERKVHASSSAPYYSPQPQYRKDYLFEKRKKDADGGRRYGPRE